MNAAGADHGSIGRRRKKLEIQNSSFRVFLPERGKSQKLASQKLADSSTFFITVEFPQGNTCFYHLSADSHRISACAL